MDGVLWIVICLFASMGFVQALGWLICVCARSRELPGGYYVLTLCEEPAALEHQLRYELTRRKWDTAVQYTYLILLDGGLNGECQDICRRMLDGVHGVFICSPDSLQRTVETFDNLQTGRQRI